MPLTQKLPWNLANSRWASELNPIIQNPLNSANILPNIKLISGVNTINHGLQRAMQGWFITDIDAAITYYRSAPLNNLTLQLTCSGPAIANIGVF